MLTTELITEIAQSMATDEGIDFPTDFDAELILTELNETSFEVSDDFEFLHDQGFALISSISRQLSL